MEFGGAVLISIATAVTYGILNDCITSSICLQYFTRGFQRKMSETWPNNWCRDWAQDETSPLKVALVWGVLATWWLGAGLGIAIGAAAEAKHFDPVDLIKPAIWAIFFMLACSVGAGIKAYFDIKAKGPSYTARHISDLNGEFPYAIDQNQLGRYEIVMHMHNMAYLAGVLAGFGMMIYVLFRG